MHTKMVFRGLASIILISLATGVIFYTPARAGLPGFEANTNPYGSVYEINPDNTGTLWITDLDAGEILGLNPATGAYDTYLVGGNPVDARKVGDWLWWADSSMPNTIGRLNTTTGLSTQWPVDAAGFLYSTYVDAQGRLYSADNMASGLYRLDPNTNKLCTYVLPLDWVSTYIVATGDYLWLGDYWGGRLLRLQPNLTSNNLKVWTLEANSSPNGMVVDAEGNIWFADQEPDSIAKFKPSLNQFTRYELPAGGDPQMLTIHEGLIWYTTQDLSTVGHLDPLTAVPSSFSATPATSSLSPTCADVTPTQMGTITPTHHTFNWTSTSYPTLVNSGGWHIFEMPAGSYPWGIALAGNGFVADPVRRVLVKFSLTQYGLYLPIVGK